MDTYLLNKLFQGENKEFRDDKEAARSLYDLGTLHVMWGTLKLKKYIVPYQPDVFKEESLKYQIWSNFLKLPAGIKLNCLISYKIHEQDYSHLSSKVVKFLRYIESYPSKFLNIVVTSNFLFPPLAWLAGWLHGIHSGVVSDWLAGYKAETKWSLRSGHWLAGWQHGKHSVVNH